MNQRNSDRAFNWHSMKDFLPAEGENVLVGHDDGSVNIGYWKSVDLEPSRIQWLSKSSSALLETIVFPTVWMALPSLEKKSNISQEKWYIFDMHAEHVDPRFLYWLYQRGIIAKVHTGGGRGLITNTIQELPPEACVIYRGLKKEKKTQLEPMFTIVEPTQSLSESIESLDEYDVLPICS